MVVVDTHVIDVAQPGGKSVSFDSKTKGGKKKKSKKSSPSNESTTLRSDAAVANYNWLHNQFMASRRREQEEEDDEDLFSNSFSSPSAHYNRSSPSYGESESLAKSDNEYISSFPRLFSQTSTSSFSMMMVGWMLFLSAIGISVFTMYAVGMVRGWAMLGTSCVLCLVAVQFIRTGSNINPKNIKGLRLLSVFLLCVAVCMGAANAYSLAQEPCVAGEAIHFSTIVLSCISRVVLYGLLIAACVVLPVFTSIFAFGLTSPHVPKSVSSDMNDSMSLSNVRALDVDSRWSEEDGGVTLLQPTPPGPAPVTSGSLRKQQQAVSAY